MIRSSSSCLARTTVSAEASKSSKRCARREADATVGVATIEVKAFVSSVEGAPKRGTVPPCPGREETSAEWAERSGGLCATKLPVGPPAPSSARFPNTPFSTRKAASSVYGTTKERQSNNKLMQEPKLKGCLTSEKPSSGSPPNCPFLPPLIAFSPSSGAAGVPSFPAVAASGCRGLNMAKLGGKVLRYASTWARRAVKASRSVERAIVGGRKASFAGWKTSQVQSSGRLRPAYQHCASAQELFRWWSAWRSLTLTIAAGRHDSVALQNQVDIKTQSTKSALMHKEC
jgi:hypothetical protein